MHVMSKDSFDVHLQRSRWWSLWFGLVHERRNKLLMHEDDTLSISSVNWMLAHIRTVPKLCSMLRFANLDDWREVGSGHFIDVSTLIYHVKRDYSCKGD